ncbi:hypothetical protein VNO77_16694 [Canavalia gladiata]|uniref:Uncharacterized protein n=1 Tax=Canavalia gladiata TaxID=3824 RepID=A0AAN9LI97_CANGL
MGRELVVDRGQREGELKGEKREELNAFHEVPFGLEGGSVPISETEPKLGEAEEPLVNPCMNRSRTNEPQTLLPEISCPSCPHKPKRHLRLLRLHHLPTLIPNMDSQITLFLSPSLLFPHHSTSLSDLSRSPITQAHRLQLHKILVDLPKR